LLLRDLESTGGEPDRLGAIAARLARLGERDARRHRAVIPLHHLPEQPLAFGGVATEYPRQADEQVALGGHRIHVIRIELEGAVDLAKQPAQLEDRRDLLAVEAEKLAKVAHDTEVGVCVVLVQSDRLGRQRLTVLEVLLAGLARAGVLSSLA